MKQTFLILLFLTFMQALHGQIPPTQPQSAVQQISQAQLQQINPLDYAISTPLISGKYEVPICITIPQTGESSIIGNQILDGMQAFFLKIKNLPDFNFYINLTPLDDTGNITKISTNIKTLLPKSPIFLSLFGSNSARASLPYLKQNKIINIFPVEGLDKWRTTKNKNSIFTRASDKNQIKALIEYSIHTLYKKRFAVFYEESEWGNEVLESIKEILKKHKISILKYASYPEGTVKIDSAVKEIAGKNPDAILCIAQTRPAYYFIIKMINKGFYKTSFLCIDRLFSIRKELRRKSPGIKIISTSVVPNSYNNQTQKSKIPIIEEYKQDMKKYFPNKLLSQISLEGYINAAILCECIKIAQFPISANKIMNTIQNIQKFNIPRLQGLNLNFNPQTRTILNRIWINTGDQKEWDEWIENKEALNENI